MKIRTGFVSNSSSSSFLVIATLNNHSKAIAALNEFQQGVICKIVKGEIVFGQQMMVGQTYEAYGEGGTFGEMVQDLIDGLEFDDAEDPNFDYQNAMYERAYAAWDEYLGELKKSPNEVFTSSNDF